jgi:hypothetical protein
MVWILGKDKTTMWPALLKEYLFLKTFPDFFGHLLTIVNLSFDISFLVCRVYPN